MTSTPYTRQMPRADTPAAGAVGPATDAALVARVAAADERALEALNDRFGGMMRAVALRVTRAEPLAEEVVQDALMAVWREPGRFDPSRGNLGPWLLTLTRYKAIDAVRRETVVRRHTADVDLDLHEAPDDVHDEAWLGIRRQRLGEAITRLPDDQRRALELAFLGGLTHVEVAERERIPLGTAKTRIRTALLKLRDELAPTIGPEGPPMPLATGAVGAGGATTGERSQGGAVQTAGPIRRPRTTEPQATSAHGRATPGDPTHRGTTDA